MRELDPRAVARLLCAIGRLIRTLIELISTVVRYSVIRHRPAQALAAENLFLRKQLALFREREVRPRRADDATRVALVWLSKAFDWRDALIIVKPATLIRWHREGFRLFWRLKSRPGRPAVPRDIQALIRRMTLENPTWGEERIANELFLKLGLQVSPRTVRKYMPERTDDGPEGWHADQRWSTFVRNHADSIVACDFFVSVTATFKILYVFVVIEHATRKILHCNVTAHPSGEWTLQQLREAIPSDHEYRFLIRDRDRKFSEDLDPSIRHLGLRVLRTPRRAPQANSLCERTIGTMRRECLDYLIPMSAGHLWRILAEWIRHFNTARPHSALGPGLPDPPDGLPVQLQAHRHRLLPSTRVSSRPILGGLHHEYGLQRAA